MYKALLIITALFLAYFSFAQENTNNKELKFKDIIDIEVTSVKN